MLTAIGDVMRRVKEGWITTRDRNIGMRKREENICISRLLDGGRPLFILKHVVRLEVMV